MSNKKITIIGSLNEFLEQLRLENKHDSEIRCFRGESKSGWSSIPTIYRDEYDKEKENEVLKELFNEVPEVFGKDKTTFEKLVRARHYSFPCRLLDVTMNPLIALYNACKERSGEEGVVKIIFVEKNRVHYPDDIEVSLLANFCLLKRESKRVLQDRKYLQNGSYEKFKKAKNTLEGLIRKEIGGFSLHNDFTTTFNKYIFVYGAKNNVRVIAQSGAFIMTGFNEDFQMKNSSFFTESKILINGNKKNEILKDLDELLSINESTIYPDFESVAKYIGNKAKKAK